MVAPGVVVASVTDTGPVKLPPVGVIVGVAAVGAVMVKVAVATGLSTNPVATASALTVLVVATLNAPVYAGELLVGGAPSVV
jgi:hypothetical protein